MKHKVIPFLLTCTLAFVLSTPTQAYTPQSEVEQVITTLSIMAGDETGNLQLDNTITRAEFITMTVNLLNGDNQVAKPSVSPYPDVGRDHWSAAYVSYGVSNGLISGYSDGTFRPNNQITLGEASVIIPNLLGYTSTDFQGYSMDSRVSWMATAGLLEGVDAQISTTPITRKDTMYLFYNALTTSLKTGGTLYQSMGYALNSDGEIDRTTLMEEKMKGPIVVTGDWESQLPFTLAQVRSVTVQGKVGELSQIGKNDLVYYIENTKSLWVYQEKRTGTIENISTSSGATSITLGGNTYLTETETAKFEFSSLGSFKKGDIVTVLLGKDEGIAMVLTPSYGDEMVAGVVTHLGTADLLDSEGNTYQGPSITVFTTENTSVTYPFENTSKITLGNIVEITTVSTDKITVTRGLAGQVFGTVSADGTTMGSYTLAHNIEIMDVYESTGAIIYPARLAGMQIGKSDVAYHRMNAQGEIDRLILKDVTGEMHTYGYLRKLESTEVTGAYVVYYNSVLSPVGETVFTLGRRYPVSEGGFYFKGLVSDPDTLENLKAVNVLRLDATSVVATSRVYPLAQNLIAIERQENKTYYLSTLARLQEMDYDTVTAYYVSNSDPYIRVILAE